MKYTIARNVYQREIKLKFECFRPSYLPTDIIVDINLDTMTDIAQERILSKISTSCMNTAVVKGSLESIEKLFRLYYEVIATGFIPCFYIDRSTIEGYYDNGTSTAEILKQCDDIDGAIISKGSTLIIADKPYDVLDININLDKNVSLIRVPNDYLDPIDQDQIFERIALIKEEFNKNVPMGLSQLMKHSNNNTRSENEKAFRCYFDGTDKNNNEAQCGDTKVLSWFDKIKKHWRG